MKRRVVNTAEKNGFTILSLKCGHSIKKAGVNRGGFRK